MCIRCTAVLSGAPADRAQTERTLLAASGRSQASWQCRQLGRQCQLVQARIRRRQLSHHELLPRELHTGKLANSDSANAAIDHDDPLSPHHAQHKNPGARDRYRLRPNLTEVPHGKGIINQSA
jgi:hypothetical protein